MLKMSIRNRNPNIKIEISTIDLIPKKVFYKYLTFGKTEKLF